MASAANRQQALPSPYFARGLWRGCRWAVNMNPWRGRTQAGSLMQHDSRSRNRGRLNGTIGAVMSQPKSGGRFMNANGGGAAGTGDTFDDVQWQAIPQLGIYMWQDTGGFTLACTMRFVAAIPNSNRRILTKRFGTAANFHCGALSFNQANGNKFEFSYCNGVTTQSIFSGLVPTFGVTYNLVGRHWGNNALSRAELWVNGKLEAVNAAPATFPAYKKDPPLIFFNDTGSGDLTCNAEASMGGLWNRPLTTTEIQTLNTNPYVMWGPPASPEGLPFAGGGGFPFCGCRCGGPFVVSWYGMG